MTAEEKRLLREALESLQRDDGLLHSLDVIEAARPEDSILHPHFEWDDSKASARYRLEQARTLIARIMISVQVGPKTTIVVPQYVSAGQSDISAYRMLASARPGTDEAHDIIAAELARVGSALERLRRIAVVLHAEDEIDALLDAVRGTHERFRTKADA